VRKVRRNGWSDRIGGKLLRMRPVGLETLRLEEVGHLTAQDESGKEKKEKGSQTGMWGYGLGASRAVYWQ